MKNKILIIGGREGGKTALAEQWMQEQGITICRPFKAVNVPCDTRPQRQIKLEYYPDVNRYYIIDRNGIKNEIPAPCIRFNNPKPWEQNTPQFIYKLLNIRLPI